MSLDQIKEKAIPILREAGVTRSSVFGSQARQSAGDDSDIDILIELPRGKTLLDFMDIKFKLEEALGRKVDLVTYKALKPQLRERILQEQVGIL